MSATVGIVSRTAAAACLAIVVYLVTARMAALINDYMLYHILGRPGVFVRFIVVCVYSGASILVARCACDRWIGSYSARAVCWVMLLAVLAVWLVSFGTFGTLNAHRLPRWLFHDPIAQTLAVVYITLAAFS